MIRAIAFDFDGVLVESVEVKTRAVASLFAAEGAEHVQDILDYHLKHLGVSRFEKFRIIYRDILKRPLTEEQSRSLGERFSKLVFDEVVAAPWVDGAEEFLSTHCECYPFFVISGTPEEELKEIIRRRGMNKYFSEVLGAPRSKEELLCEIMMRHRLAPLELVFVGDSGTDWIAARETGIPFIWRRASSEMPRPRGFSGPGISSLAHLQACLLALEKQEVLKG